MAFEFRLPDIGEGIHEGEILKWFVAKGDKINEDDALCEVQNDKAVVEIPSPLPFLEVLVSEGLFNCRMCLFVLMPGFEHLYAR